MTVRRVLKTFLACGIAGAVVSGVALARRAPFSPSGSIRPVMVHHEKSGNLPLTHSGPVGSDSSHSLTLAVDGAKTPELIPDELAYRHLLAATAPSARLLPKQRAGIRNRIAKIGLSQDDANYYEETLKLIGVRDELTRISEERASLNAAAAKRSQTAITRLPLLRVQEENLMHYAKAQVIKGLTPAGAAALERHIRTHVKLQIKILRGGHMSSQANDVRKSS